MPPDRLTLVGRDSELDPVVQLFCTPVFPRLSSFRYLHVRIQYRPCQQQTCSVPDLPLFSRRTPGIYDPSPNGGLPQGRLGQAPAVVSTSGIANRGLTLRSPVRKRASSFLRQSQGPPSGLELRCDSRGGEGSGDKRELIITFIFPEEELPAYPFGKGQTPVAPWDE
jgi:hypothetical protein